MKVLFLSVLLAYFVAPGTALKCIQCAGSSSLCFANEICKPNQLCYSANIIAGPATGYFSGCIDKGQCGKTVSESYLGVQYTMTKKCCDFDNCNGATATQLSVLAISVMVLAWFVGFQ